MKRNLLIIFIVFLCTNSHSQPTLQNANNFPLPGTSYSVDHLSDTTGMSVTGANCFWSFSKAVTNNLGMLSIESPFTTPFYSSFPNSDFSFVQSYATPLYNYLINSPNKLECIGNTIDSSTGIGQYYTPNPLTWLPFPFAFQDTVSDSYQATGANAESVLLTYDSYGTLYLPAVTYTNVVRIKMDYSFGSEIMWWSTSPLFPVMYYKLNVPSLYAFTYIPSSSVINNQENTTFTISPNPANSTILVNYSNMVTNNTASIDIIDILGNILKSVRINHSDKGVASIAINDLAAGFYFIKIPAKNNVIVKSFIRE